MEQRTSDQGIGISRRNLLLGLPAMGMATKLIGQLKKPSMPVRSLNHMTLNVTDLKRSVEFYQGLFGMPVQSRHESVVALRIGRGPEMVVLSAGGANSAPGFNHLCMTTDNFDVDRIKKILGEHGVTESASVSSGGPMASAMKYHVRILGEEGGGDKRGTPELYIGDPDGIVLQIQDTKYCGGSGLLGEVCPTIESSPSKGLLALRDLSHFTFFVSDQHRTMAFYQSLFALPIQAHQGPTPLLGVGSDHQFLTIVGGFGSGRAGAPPPGINHASFRMEGFNPDQVLKKLAEFGVKPRGDARGPAGPLLSYVTMRGEDRGGAKEGTPELYFTDPDGILLQIQDVSYCGGAGRMGEVCP
jgi:catechol 2,3-dioxygenase-like lactoylglutathione lyase family enzyme